MKRPIVSGALLVLASAVVSGNAARASGNDATGTDPMATNSHSTVAQQSTLTLHVSNQSFADDPVRITIRIDGDIVVDDAFYVENQHNWVTFELAVAPGDHELVMTSSTGVTQSADLSIPEQGHRWAVANYWYYPPNSGQPGGGEIPRSFTFFVDDEPIIFG